MNKIKKVLDWANKYYHLNINRIKFFEPAKDQMQRLKPSESNLRRFAMSPRNRVLSSPKFDLVKIVPEQEQRVRNYVYKKSNLLGQGYSSKVYKAHKENEPYKPYSIKVIDLGKLNFEQRKHLEVELKIHKNLSHPHIVKCHQTFKTTSAYYLILDYCQHGTLSDYLKRHKKLDQTSVIHILSQVIQAYIYLIDLKILHRDLKPQNVIRKEYTWKVIDFGFCCKIERQFYQGDLNVGTPLYMPLESLIQNIYSHKSDIYSIGIMTYKMLTGSTPWKCSTERELIHLMKNQTISFPQLKNQYLAQFLHRSLQMDVQKRLDIEGFKHLYEKIKNEQVQLHKQYQLGNDLKKFESSRSITTAESVTHSSHGIMTPPQTTLTSSVNSTAHTRQINKKPEFDENSLIIASELEICRLIHHMLLNIDSFIVSDNFQNPESGYEIHCNIKEVLVTFFYKYVLKKIRMLNSYFTSQQSETIEEDFSLMGVKACKQFRKSAAFANLAIIVKEKLAFYEAEFLQSYIKKSILTIRFINKRFPELGQNNIPLSSKFYSNFLDFIKPEIQNLNSYILENLERAKNANKTMKKDRILAFSFWIRLYVEFIERFKFLEFIEKQKQREIELNSENKQIGSSSKNIKSLAQNLINSPESLALNNQLEKLKSFKKAIKIQFLYNFKETTLEFKEFLSLRKKLTQVYQMAK